MTICLHHSCSGLKCTGKFKGMTCAKNMHQWLDDEDDLIGRPARNYSVLVVVILVLVALMLAAFGVFFAILAYIIHTGAIHT